MKPRLDTATFVARARAVHGAVYDYSEVEYKNARTKVRINCSLHGTFEQTPDAHLRPQGCSRCGDTSVSLKRRASLAHFLGRAADAHGDKYDYSKVQYVNARTSCTVGCKEHGYFNILPVDHWEGNGCAKCSTCGFKLLSPAVLYVFSAPGVVKVGVTNRPTKKRLAEVNTNSPSKFTLVCELPFESGQAALDVEQRTLARLAALYTPVKEKFCGSTECFYAVSAEPAVQIAKEEYERRDV